MDLRRCSVAVVGGGAAGLVAARELRREGHQVTVFEQGNQVGGVWIYDEEMENDDLLGTNPSRQKVHSSMYRHLRTNLPREIMGFADFPFTPLMMGPGRAADPRRFCSHVEVANYLKAFADFFQLNELVRFGECVLRVTPLDHQLELEHPAGSPSGLSNDAAHSSPGELNSKSSAAPPHHRWRVQTRRSTAGRDNTAQLPGQADVMEADFDAVVVCNGHYSEPKLPEVCGMDEFPGFQMHSHNYRLPDKFRDQVVLVIGASNSGEDISREVAGVASRVYLSARGWKQESSSDIAATPFGPRANIFRCSLVEELTGDSYAVFPDGQRVGPVQSVIYCTGYKYTFPFMLGHDSQQGPNILSDSDDSQSQQGQHKQQATAATSPAASSTVIRINEQRVGPLYLHMFPPALAPGLSLLGLPWKVVPFPQFELQAKLVARLLSGRAQLPSVEDMMRDVHAYYQQLEQQDVPVRYTHMQGQAQWSYNDALACMCGADVPKTPEWRVQMYTETGVNRRANPETYRDGPFSAEDQTALRAAYQELDEVAHALIQQRNRGSEG